MLPCYFKKYLNVECPGCGMQRAFSYLMDGDLVASFKAHPALIPLILTFVMLALQLFFKWKFGGKVIIYLFAFSAAIIVVNYVVKVVEGKI